MRIYSMTATFGKLEHETLTLQPGLNIVQAPNEWGKSTWCAFLVAMLYGLDTRAKSTKTTLAEKERYAPWSGDPMAGRMDLNWNGRDITIERKTKGRVILGEFRAYETASGLEVKELTAANCGSMLLGVERSVFTRSGFIRLSDLPVTDDEALRRRLNALVTTGDESSAGDRLAKGLKELKNRIRYNRTGLLPQAEGERTALEDTIRELDGLREQSEKLTRRLDEIEDWRILLENHRTALACDAAREDARQVEQARRAREEAAQHLSDAKALCDALPERERAEQVLAQIRTLQEQQSQLQLELQLVPSQEESVQPPAPFEGLCAEDAVAMAKTDRDRYRTLGKNCNFLLIFPLVLAAAGGILAIWYLIPGLACVGAGAALLVTAWITGNNRRRQARLLEEHYGSGDADEWVCAAERYAEQLRRQRHSAEENRRQRQVLERRLKELNENIREATRGQGLERCRSDWEGAIAAWDACADAYRDWQRAENHYQTLKAMAKTAPEPEFPDKMDYSEADTARLLSDCLAERHRLENRLGQHQGRMEALGDRAALENRLARLNSRISRLEETYAALTVAQETLAEATAELQRRFAPRISKRAQELMGQLTGGRYDRVSLDRNLALRAGTEREDTLREALWRSDGTVDQLYLALRLAVSEELTPGAPLILDDALVRFDDVRLRYALEILRAESERKQVILFSCQSREKDMERKL